MADPLDDTEQYVGVTVRNEAVEEDAPPTRTRRSRPTVASNPDVADEDAGAGTAETGAPARGEDPELAVRRITDRARDQERQIADLQRERLEAQRRVEELERGQADARSASVSAQKLALEATLAAEDRRIAAARQRYRAAREAGDIDGEDAANDELADARANKRLLERDKQAWDEWEREQQAQAQRQPARQERQPEPQQQAPEQWTDADRRWIAEHPEFEQDADCEIYVRTAAQRAMQRGISFRSEAFYEAASRAYDRFQQLRSYEHGDADPAPQQREQAPAAPRARQPSAASMAPSPSRGMGGGGRKPAPSIEAVARRLGSSVEEIRSFARAQGQNVDAYVREVASDLGLG